MIALIGKGLNYNGWTAVAKILEAYQLDFYISKDGKQLPEDPLLYIIIGCYDKLSDSILQSPKFGSILFHSSDLPEGRGWSPIYHTIADNHPYLIQSMIFPNQIIDGGTIIAKAKLPLHGYELDSEVRRLDDLLTLKLLSETLQDLLNGKIKKRGVTQDDSKATYYKKRTPADSEIDISKPLVETLDKLRAYPDSAPAFLNYKGRKFFITMTAEDIISHVENNDIKIEKYY